MNQDNLSHVSPRGWFHGPDFPEFLWLLVVTDTALEAVTEWSKREWRGTDSSSISCRNTNMLLGVEAAKPARGLLRDLFLVLFKIAIKWQKVVLKPPLNNFIIVCCLCHRRVKLINC